ncbi:MAG: carbohydrate kinase family protein [Armatimonadetes bacterium]|nr:carbohydrate kinase family protein [Armatimonadota bacterium]
MYDCVSIGSATQDVFVFSQGTQIHRLQTIDGEQAFLAFEYGAKVRVEEMFISVGGGAVNTAIAIARLGLHTAIVCETGDDDAACRICAALQEGGVDTSMVVRNPRISTGYSVIITGFDGDRTVLVHRGASTDLSRREIDWERVAQTRWIYLGSMAGASAQLWDDIAAFAAERKIRLAINPGSTQFERGLSGMAPVLAVTDVIFVNRSEAYRLADVELRRGDQDEQEAMRRLHAAGCKLVVMTSGRQGAHAFDGQRFYFCPAREVQVVSNLGAGDAFASACLAALHRGLDIEQALCAGSLNAAGVVGQMGATTGLLSWDQIAAGLGDDRQP